MGLFHILTSFLSIFDERLLALDTVHLNEYFLLSNDLLERIFSLLKVFAEMVEQNSDNRKRTIFVVPLLRQFLFAVYGLVPHFFAEPSFLIVSARN